MHAQAVRFLLPLACVLSVAPAVRADDTKPVKATVRSADGLTIAYDVRGKGDTALVFLHGWCGDRQSWKHQLDTFAADYRVVAIDLGGHGESGKDRKAWSVTGLAGDVVTVVQALGLKRVVLIGHSMGGPVSLAAAARLPGVVAGVVGVDTLHNAEYQWSEEQMKQFAQGFEADFKGSMRNTLPGMFPKDHDPALREWITARAEAQDPTMAIGLFRDFPRLDLKALFRGAKVPVRCINSGTGYPFGMATAVDVNKKYADYGMVQMDGVGHFPMLEKPEAFNQKLRDVLKEFGGK
jgi:pimeloyl-ACP methyl ester carboxylesterase